MKNTLWYLVILLFIASCGKKDSPDPNTSSTTQTAGPTLTSLNSASGPGGTTITINGTGFDPTGNNQVFFNGVAAVVLSATNTQIVATVPVGAGTGPVSVKVLNKTVTGLVFTYVKAPFVYSLAGNGKSGNANGVGTFASFGGITATAVDLSGNIYVADYTNGGVRKIDNQGNVTTFWHNPAPISNILGLTTDAAGNLYMLDSNNSVIWKVTPAGAASVFAGSSGVVGNVDGLGTAASFSNPAAMTIDANGNLYVMDGGANVPIRKITPAGIVSTVVKTVSFFNGPRYGIAVDAASNIYITGNVINGVFLAGSYLLKINTSGAISAVSSGFNKPVGLALDNTTGNFYVADTGDNKIWVVSPTGNATTYAGTGATGYSDGLASNALFSYPNSIAIDKSGNIFLSDAGNYAIRGIVIE